MLDDLLIDLVTITKVRTYSNPTAPGLPNYRPPQDNGGGFKQEYDPQGLPGNAPSPNGISVICNVQCDGASKNTDNKRVSTDIGCTVYFMADPGVTVTDKIIWNSTNGVSRQNSNGSFPIISCDGPAIDQTSRGVWMMRGVIRPV